MDFISILKPLSSDQGNWFTSAMRIIFSSENFRECWELNPGQLSQGSSMLTTVLYCHAAAPRFDQALVCRIIQVQAHFSSFIFSFSVLYLFPHRSFFFHWPTAAYFLLSLIFCFSFKLFVGSDPVEKKPVLSYSCRSVLARSRQQQRQPIPNKPEQVRLLTSEDKPWSRLINNVELGEAA